MNICVLIDAGHKKFDAGYYLQNHSWKKHVMRTPVMGTLRSIMKSGDYDVYLNLCDGYAYGSYTGIDVVRVMEMLNIPFTGSDTQFFDPSRDEMLAAAKQMKVRFVQGVTVIDMGKLDTLTKKLHFPLIVKHPNSYGSAGMTRKSRVVDKRELHVQVRRFIKTYGSARVEEFIDGREFTSFVVENPDDPDKPYVYPPAELIFPPGETFLHERVKWIEYVYLKRVTDMSIVQRLKIRTRKLFLGLNGVGYARCDFRMDSKGRLYMLEINPNNGILYEPKDLGPADIMIEYDKGGHDGFLDRIFRSAILHRQNRAEAGN